MAAYTASCFLHWAPQWALHHVLLHIWTLFHALSNTWDFSTFVARDLSKWSNPFWHSAWKSGQVKKCRIPQGKKKFLNIKTTFIIISLLSQRSCFCPPSTCACLYLFVFVISVFQSFKLCLSRGISALLWSSGGCIILIRLKVSRVIQTAGSLLYGSVFFLELTFCISKNGKNKPVLWQSSCQSITSREFYRNNNMLILFPGQLF